MLSDMIEIATVFSEIEGSMSEVIENVKAENSFFTNLFPCPLSIFRGRQVILISDIESDRHLI